MSLKSNEIKIHRWLPVKVTEANGCVTANVYDTSGRLICTVRGGRLFVAQELLSMGIEFGLQERPELINGRSLCAVNRTSPRE